MMTAQVEDHEEETSEVLRGDGGLVETQLGREGHDLDSIHYLVPTELFSC